MVFGDINVHLQVAKLEAIREPGELNMHLEDTV
jgi:hypothetical protein